MAWNFLKQFKLYTLLTCLKVAKFKTFWNGIVENVVSLHCQAF